MEHNKDMQAFRKQAAFYEVFANAAARLEREGPFLLEQLRQVPDSHVLDLACGTGLHAQFFADHGATVTAIDASSEMIAYAEQARPHPRITYKVGDMRHNLAEGVDLAVCLGNSMSLLSTERHVEAVFREVGRSLNRGGRFIVQVVNYAAPQHKEPRLRTEADTVEGGHLVAVKSLVHRNAKTYLTLSYFLDGEGGCEMSSENAVLYHWSRGDFESAARAASLLATGSYGGFDGRPFDAAASGDLVMVFQKA